MDINRVRNSTLAKLTAKEIGELDLLNYGVMTYRGTLKSRRRGWKTEKVDEKQINFIHDELPFRCEFIMLPQTGETQEWAMRIYDTELNTYNVHLQPLAGVDFLK